MNIKRNILLIIIILLHVNLYSQQQQNKFAVLKNAVNKLKNDADLKNAGISFYAVDVSTGETVAELNPDLVLKPASTMKVITTATALEVLGANYKFCTELQYDGKLDTATGILNGNLYIKGGGDPTLGSKYFQSTKNHQFLDKWLDAVKSAGIDSITGYIIGDATKYSWQMIPPTWSWEDFGNYFGAGPCGLTVYDNLYTLYFNTGSSVGAKTTITKIEPEIPNLTFDNQVVAANIRSDMSYIFGVPYTYNRFISGRLPMSRTDYKVKGAMPDPALMTAQKLCNKLNINGITVGKQAITIRILDDANYLNNKRQTISKIYSPTLKYIVNILNNRSVNLFAEHLLVEAANKKSGVNDVKSATNIVESFWQYKGMNTAGFSMNDGSGLSHYNHISSKHLVFILRYMAKKSKNYDNFYNSLPISGKSGTLRNVCKNTIAHGKVHAKSGSIRGVRCYAGYTTTQSGREIAFAAMINNYNCSSSESKKKLEKIMIAMVSVSD